MTTYSETLQRFGLKIKPIRDYKDGCSLWFTIENGKMFCEFMVTTRTITTRIMQGSKVIDEIPKHAEKGEIQRFEVIDRPHLDKLLNAKTVSEVQALDAVKQS